LAVFALFLSVAAGCHSRLSRSIGTVDLNTWSLVAVDSVTGDVGVVGASCVPLKHVDAIAALVPDKGGAVIQGLWSLQNRDRVFEWLRAGRAADEILNRIRELPDVDMKQRQYGIVTLRNRVAATATFTGAEALPWSGSRQDENMAVTVQGNVLESEAVATEALAAFKAANKEGLNLLTDRLMRGIEAGSGAGGDRRCNTAAGRQTAASAFILFARSGDPPYVAKDIGSSDAGSPAAPFLALSVTVGRDAGNPILELRKQYDAWRARTPRMR
jgi:uncharacterized Ntn-hydrolase superfamily protein